MISGGPVLAVKAITPLEVPVWAPLDNQASGFKVAGRLKARANNDWKMSQRLVMASAWEMLVGDDAPVRALVTNLRP
jgi:hypothetical protein